MKSKKLRHADFNNRKKQITVVYMNGKKLSIHYSSLGIEQNINAIWIDKETGGMSLGIEFKDGSIDYMPYDQPLAIVNDAEFLLQTHIEILVFKINETLKKKKISKKHLAEKLNTSENQIYRLLNPTILNKNLAQLYRIAELLDLELVIEIQEDA